MSLELLLSGTAAAEVRLIPCFSPAAVGRRQMREQPLEGTVKSRGYMLHAQKALQRKCRTATRVPTVDVVHIKETTGSTELETGISTCSEQTDLTKGDTRSHVTVNRVDPRWGW